MDVRSTRWHAEQQCGDAAQQSRLAGLVVAIDHEEVRLALWDVDFPLEEVAVTNKIEGVDSHTVSRAERRASSSASASSMAVARARASTTIGSASPTLS